MKGKNVDITNSYEGVFTALFISIALVALGVVMWRFPEIEYANFYRFLGIAVVIFGLARIIRYLLRNEYRTIKSYGLSIGLLMASIGVCVFNAAERLRQASVQFIGIFVLINAVIMLQYAIQIHIMDGRMFPLAMILALLVYTFGMAAIIEPHNIFHIYTVGFSFGVGLAGVFGLISLSLTVIRIRNLEREEARDVQRILEEDFTEDTFVETTSSEPVNEEVRTDFEAVDTVDDMVSPLKDEVVPESAEKMTGEEEKCLPMISSDEGSDQ